MLTGGIHRSPPERSRWPPTSPPSTSGAGKVSTSGASLATRGYCRRPPALSRLTDGLGSQLGSGRHEVGPPVLQDLGDT